MLTSPSTPRYSAPIPSDCRYCNPAAESNDWSVQDGFNADPSRDRAEIDRRVARAREGRIAAAATTRIVRAAAS